MSAANGTQRDIGLDLTRILAFLAVPSVHFFLNSTYYDTAIVGPRMALMTVMRTAFMVCGSSSQGACCSKHSFEER